MKGSLEISLAVLKTKKIAIIGYGNQGRAQAQNLKDGGFDVLIGIRENSRSIQKIIKDNHKYLNIADACAWADVILILTPDEAIKEVYINHISNQMAIGKTIIFAHGYAIYYKLIRIPKEVNVILVAPSAPGSTVRANYKNRKGIPCLIAVENDFSRDSREVAMAYAKAIGCADGRYIESSFKEETETDLFGEQSILTGGLLYILKESFKVLVERGYSPVVAWHVCFYESENILSLLNRSGYKEFYNSVSSNARYGGVTRGKRIISNEVVNEMHKILDEIQSGDYVKEIDSQTNLDDYKQLYKAIIDDTLEKAFKKQIKKK